MSEDQSITIDLTAHPGVDLKPGFVLTTQDHKRYRVTEVNGLRLKAVPHVDKAERGWRPMLLVYALLFGIALALIGWALDVPHGH